MRARGVSRPTDGFWPKRLASTSLVLLGLALPAQGQESIEARVASYLEEAKRAESVQDYLAAAEQYEAILELRPEWALVHQSLGVTYHLAKQYSEAIGHLERAVQLDDQLWGAYLFLGMDYYQTHQFAVALSALERSLALNPEVAETSRWLGLSHSALGNYEEAIAHLLSVIASDAEDVEALFHLVRAYDGRAAQLFGSIGETDPDSPFVYMLQAERFASENDLPRAKAEYRRALELRPDLAGILDRIELASAVPGSQPAQSQNTFAGIRSSFASGRFQDAALEAKGLLASQPQNAEAMYWLGRAYQSLATGTVDSLTEVAPESYRVDQLAGELHEERTEYESAVAAYRRALRKAPEVPGLRYAIATSYWKMGNFTDALEWLEEELDRNPHHARARYRLGNLLVDRGRPEDAIPHLLQALAATPDLAEARFDLGRAYLEGQQHAAAAAELEAYAQSNPANDRVHYLLGNAYRGLGRLEDARREFQTYQELSRRRLRKIQQDVKSVAEDINRADP